MSKVILAWAEDAHSHAISEIYAPIVRETAISFEVQTPSSAVISHRIGEITVDNPYIVALIDKKIVGYAYSVDFRQRKAYRFTKEATVYVHEEYRKQGVASALYLKLFELLKAQGVVKIIAVITIPNDKSILFHEKLGFELSGTIKESGYKFDQFWDVSFYEKTIHENLNSSPELKEWEEVKNLFPELTG